MSGAFGWVNALGQHRVRACTGQGTMPRWIEIVLIQRSVRLVLSVDLDAPSCRSGTAQVFVGGANPSYLSLSCDLGLLDALDALQGHLLENVGLDRPETTQGLWVRASTISNLD